MSWLSAIVSSCSGWFTPRIERDEAEQQRVDRLANTLTLYVIPSCSLCTKLKRHLQVLNVPVTVKDLKRCHIYEKELFSGLGAAKIPALRVEKGTEVLWLASYDEILHFLDKKFAPIAQLDKIGQAH